MAAKEKGRKQVPSFRDRLRLLLEGSMPLVRSRLGRVLYRVRSLRSLLAGVAIRLHRLGLPRAVQATMFLAGSLAIAAFAVFNALYTTGTTVTLDGVALATVASPEEAEAARLSVERSISDVVGYDYTLEDSPASPPAARWWTRRSWRRPSATPCGWWSTATPCM